MEVKGNQERLLDALQQWFDDPPALRSLDFRQASQTDKGHGRIETRILTASTDLSDYLDWPAVQQAFCQDCTVIHTKTGEVTTERRYGITDLAPDQASEQQLLALWRRHWTIENNLHYPLDVWFQEDASRIHSGSSPVVMALLRKLVINFIRSFPHYASIKYARERFATRPSSTLDLIEMSI